MNKTTRVTVDLTPRMYGRLESLEERTDAVSKADVFRQALRIYEELVTWSEEGHELIIRNELGEETRVFIGGLPRKLPPTKE